MRKHSLLWIVILGAFLALVRPALADTPIPTVTPPTLLYDWTFDMHFSASDYCFNIIEGSYAEDEGLMFGDLLLGGINNRNFVGNFQFFRDVTPLQAIIYFDQVGFDPEPSFMYGNINVFGIETSFSQSLEAGGGGVAFYSQYAGTHGDSINLSMTDHASDNESESIAIDEILISGMGTDPFANLPYGYFTDTCSIVATETPSPTPAPPTNTLTPTSTFTPSDTLTPSNTPAPSDTPTPTDTPSYQCTNINFDGDDELPWSVVAESHGQGDYSIESGGQSGDFLQSGAAGTFSGFYQNGLYFVIDISNLVGITSMSWYDHADVLGSNGGSQYQITVGDESNPFTSIAHDFGGLQPSTSWSFNSLSSMSVAGNTRLAIVIYRSSDTATYFGLDHLQICFDGGYITSPTPTQTLTPTHTLTPSRTPTASRTPNPFATPTQTPFPLSLTPATATPTFTPSNTRVVIPTPFPSFTPPPLGTLPPTTTPFLTSTPLVTATTGTPVVTAVEVIWPTSTVNSSLGNNAGAIVGFISNVISQSTAYLGQLVTKLNGVLAAWKNAPTTAISGLPNCVNNRFGSELCAIYYILTWTIFAGPIGSLIVPMGIIDIDLVIIFTFLKLARAIKSRLEELMKS